MQNSQGHDRAVPYRHLQTKHVQELAQMHPSRDRRYVQLEAGRFEGDLVHLRLPGVQLFRERMNVGLHVQGAPMPGRVPFGVVSCPPAGARFCDFELKPGAIVQAYGPWDLRFKRKLEYVYWVFEREGFERRGFDLCGGPVDPTWLRTELRYGDPVAVARLEARAREMLAASPPAGEEFHGIARLLGAELLELTLATLMSAGNQPRVEPAWRRRRAVKRALEFLDLEAEVHLTIPDLCRVAGVSQRTLEYGFRDLLGVTPKRYLTLLRLNRARRRLIDEASDGATVAAVALQFGFTELGRFAVEYRQLFGERPSDTLRCS